MAATSPICVIVADDSVDLLGAIRARLQREADITVVGTLTSADDLVAAVEAQHPNVIVVDITMPGREPLDAVREISKRHPEVRTIVCSGYDDQATIQSALSAGAVGFVSKNAEVDAIVVTVRSVADGQVCIRR